MIKELDPNEINKIRESIAEKRIDQMKDESEIKARFDLINKIRDSVDIIPNKIVFLNFSGNYDCNLKPIANEILKRGLDYELIWGTFEHNHLDDPDNFPSSIKVFVRETYEFYVHLASAKIIIDNSINMNLIGYKKKPGQILIETWHGAMGIKKFGPDGNDDFAWHKLAREEALSTDYIISNSKLENKVYRDTFWTETPILKYGHPRNDILFLKNEKQIETIKNNILDRYKISNDKKICLYAPTFRDDHNLDVYMFNIEKLKLALKQRFGGDWVILCRYHDGIIRTYWDYTKFPDGVINVSDYPDIQELMLIIDAGITDYSSWICEYVLRKKPGFLYAPDYEQYSTSERKLLIPLEETPFPLATNEEILFDNIRSFDNKKYVKSCKAFIKKHGNVDKGKASKKTVNKIVSLLK